MAEHGWRELQDELDAWTDAGRVATLWWRDDDASGPSPALDRLLALQSHYGVPLALAVIPQRLDPSLASLLQAGESGRRTTTPPASGKELRQRIRVSAGMTESTPGADSRHSRGSANPHKTIDHGGFHSGVSVLQHGFAHRNHAGAGEKSMELGSHRPQDQVLSELRSGFSRLAKSFEERFLPVLVPPWNRIAAPLLPELPSLGLCGLSTFMPRTQPNPVPGLRQVNCHADLIDWRGGRRGRDHGVLAREVAGHLRARREGRADAGEPTGLLTHHLDHDESAWSFVEEFLDRVALHPGVHWPDSGEVFLD